MMWIAIRSQAERLPGGDPGALGRAASAPLSRPLQTGAAPGTARRFRAWQGRSGKDYTVSVYPLDLCPDYAGAVIIAVSGENGRAVWIGDSGEGGGALLERLAAAARQGADEVHVHLLAEDAATRTAIVADLSAASRRLGALPGPAGSMTAAAAGEVRFLHQKRRHAEQDEQRRQH